MAAAQGDSAAMPVSAVTAAPGGAKPSEKQSAEKQSALREQALADAGVQTMLECFPRRPRRRGNGNPGDEKQAQQMQERLQKEMTARPSKATPAAHGHGPHQRRQ